MTTRGFSGVLVPVVTPFKPDLAPDSQRFLALCKALIAEGADGLAVFGTTSEANSIGAPERMALLDMLVDNGIPPELLMPGVGATALEDVIQSIHHASRLGCGGVLLLPPFYYKAVTDDGLFDFVSAVIGRVNSSPAIYLYHIPPVAHIGFSHDLIERLIVEFPRQIVGIKDSSGDFANTTALIERFPGFRVFSGSEVFLLETLRAGGAGCITATGSVNLVGIRDVYAGWQGSDADELQSHASGIREIIQKYPVVPALKAVLAHATGDPAWGLVRPPMRQLDAQVASRLIAELEGVGFAVPDRIVELNREGGRSGASGSFSDSATSLRPAGRLSDSIRSGAASD